MPLTLTPDEHAKLVEIACHEFLTGHHFGIYARHHGLVTPRAGEVIMVSHFCLSMMDAARSWNAELRRMGQPHALTVSTVFTHQRPYVRFVSPTVKLGCEMADMLVVVVDRTTISPTGTALLLQAKLSDQHHVTLRNDSEKKQFELFEQHPSFNLRAGGPQGVQLAHTTASGGLRYAITGAAHLVPDGVHVFPWRWHPHAWFNSAAVAGSGLNYRVEARECIANMLVDMLTFSAGSAFVPNHVINTATPSTWDDLINYLLRTTFHQTLNTRNPANAGRPIRGAEVIMSYVDGGSERFLAAVSAPSDTDGPVSWLGVGSVAKEDEGARSAEREKLELMLEKMVERLVRDFTERPSGGGGGDDKNPPDVEGETGGEISAIVIEIVNSEARRAEG